MTLVQSVQDIQDMARGAAVLGTGGGGDPYIGELFVRAQITRGRYPIVVPSEEIADDAFVLSVAGLGAPTVLVEYLASEHTLRRLLARAESFFGRKVEALISAEIGGVNSMFPLALSAMTGIPVVDADGIGRAIPQLEMTMFSILGCRATPCVLMDDMGNVAIVDAVTDRLAENLCRAITMELGALTFCAIYPMTGAQARTCAVQRTVTHTLEIGRCIRQARESSADVVTVLLSYLNAWPGRTARILFDGKIADVARETRDGWHHGRVTLCGLGDPTDTCTVDIRNEFIVARVNGRLAAIVPDLITILDRETGEPITGERLAYGQRVKVVGFSADPLLRRPESLAVIGPRLFGLDEDFQPVEAL